MLHTASILGVDVEAHQAGAPVPGSAVERGQDLYTLEMLAREYAQVHPDAEAACVHVQYAGGLQKERGCLERQER